jgi:hypothetical protein
MRVIVFTAISRRAIDACAKRKKKFVAAVRAAKL